MPYPVSAIQLLGQTIDGGALKIQAILGAGAFGVLSDHRNNETKLKA